ncbi:MAG: Pr6Pr family membrane protein [Rhodobacteraceae bacterium]|nr:Pr6Pr family membrane protein [Paracoccaceae bacterium]
MPIDPKYRVVAGVIGALGVAALGAQIGLNMARWNMGAIAVIWALAGFFTILTNALMAATMLWIAASGQRAAFGWMSMLTMSMIMVGLVYHLLLAHLYNFAGLAWWTDHAFHTILPALMAWFWLTETARIPPRGGRPLFWLIWPAGYAVYALLRGALSGWYPYPFINAAELGLGALVLNVTGLLAAFAVFAFGLNALGRRMPLRQL